MFRVSRFLTMLVVLLHALRLHITPWTTILNHELIAICLFHSNPCFLSPPLCLIIRLRDPSRLKVDVESSLAVGTLPVRNIRLRLLSYSRRLMSLGRRGWETADFLEAGTRAETGHAPSSAAGWRVEEARYRIVEGVV